MVQASNPSEKPDGTVLFELADTSPSFKAALVRLCPLCVPGSLLC